MEHEDNISKVRSRTLTKKLGNSNEEYITLNEINDLIFSLNLHTIITKDEASRIFKSIDIENKGKVNKLVFLNKLEESNKEDNCYLLFQELTRNFSSKCEKIIQILKQIKSIEALQNQGQVLSDLDWIIDSITNEDIYEPELYTSDSLNKSVVKDFMGQITTVESLQLKKKDLEKISQSQDIHKTKSFLAIKKQRATVYKEEISKFTLNNVNNEGLSNLETEKNNFKHHKFLSYDNKNKNSILDEENLEKIKELYENINNTNVEEENSNDEIYQKDRSNSLFNEDDLLSDLCLQNKSKINECLKYIDDFSFDIFALEEYTGKSLLKVMSLEIFYQKNYFQTIVNKNTFLNFIDEITNGYTRNITYHNDIHAADVFQTVFVMFSVGNIEEKLKLRELDIFSTLIASILHDYKHPGFNNFYHINAKTNIALTYNDIAVLESYHVSEAFKVMQDKRNNIFENISDEEYRVARRRIIESILSTDMASHGKHLTQLKAKLESLNINEGNNLEKIVSDNVNKNYESQQIILNMMVHSADVSNPGKIKSVYVKWVDLIFNEFFNQGDVEKSIGLSVSLLCDRESTNINKSQIGFINFIVKPTFECMINIIPNLSVYMDNIIVNCKYYEDMVKVEEEKKSSLLNNVKQ